MIPKECKRLAEVDFPIAVVSKHAAREKSGPPGYPSRLHIWWAHRPLGACRAVLLSMLLPDPCDPSCPPDFRTAARVALQRIRGNVGPTDSDLQHSLLHFIGEFTDWNLVSQPAYLEVARALVNAAQKEVRYVVSDPFAGRGSIPLEALRLGCDALATDLNPVACFILRILLQYIPRDPDRLAESLESIGGSVQHALCGAVNSFYPTDSDGNHPIAYLWARTVKCESPKCGAEVPIYKSPWLAKKGASGARYFQESPSGTNVALLVAKSPVGGPIEFRIARGNTSAEPKPGFVELQATKVRGNNANVMCPCCNQVLQGGKSNPRVPSQLAAQHGGVDCVFDDSGARIGGARLLAVVTRPSSGHGQSYRLPTRADYDAVRKAQHALREQERKGGPYVPLHEPTPTGGGSGAGRAFSVQRYGMMTFDNLFTARQKLTLSFLLADIQEQAKGDNAILNLLAAAFNRVAMSGMTCTRWNAVGQKMQHTFGRQALPIVWDFAEVVPTAEAPGNWTSGYELVAEVIRKWRCKSQVGEVELADARNTPTLDESVDVWFTDPPYYDAVPYADLADFFFVWLKRLLPGDRLIRDPFDSTNALTPKVYEIVQDETRTCDGRQKDGVCFENMMAAAFRDGRRVLKDAGIGCVVFAHKTTEGWEALLSGLIRGGWTITASWPLATEMATRLRARESAALATSVHLICRPRPDDAGIGDWAHVVRDLPKRVGDWMERLQGEGIRGADLVFACIGPALEIYSRYEKVVDAEEREIPLGGDAEAKEPHLRGYLAYVWEVVGRLALEQVLGTAEAKARNGAAGALEEDSRLTALFLWTMQATDANATNDDAEEDDNDTDDEDDDTPRGKKKAGFSLSFDVVRRFAQPLGIHLPEWEPRIIETEKGVVRLLPVSERARLLFGEDGADAVADWLQSDPPKSGSPQMMLFGEEPPTPKRSRKSHVKSDQNVSDESLKARREATTLDRVHMAMLLQASGRTNALRALLQAEQDRSPDFVRLSNALSALYPADSEEKRLLDAMLLAVPR